jgi:hypothetical protein
LLRGLSLLLRRRRRRNLGVLMLGVLGGMSRRVGKTPTGSASRCLGKRKKKYPNDRNSSNAIHATLNCGLLGVDQLKHQRRRQGSLPFFNGAFFGLAR